MQQIRTFLFSCVLGFLLVGCTNPGNVRTSQPACTLLSVAAATAGLALTGGSAVALMGGAVDGGLLSLSVCQKKQKEIIAEKEVIEIADQDHDGVPDNDDFCPDTPAEITVDKQGCPLDSDEDGVWDYRDKCPDTAPRVIVKSDGCPFPLVLETVHFSFDSAVLTDEAKTRLDKVSTSLKQNPYTYLVVEGNTDNTGSAEYNEKLSLQRAQSVIDYMSSNGIDYRRLYRYGSGELHPIASNKTAEGRQRNRRVGFLVVDSTLFE